MPTTIPIDIVGATLDTHTWHYIIPGVCEECSSDYATDRAVVGVRYHRPETFQLGRGGYTLDQPHSPVVGLAF